MSMTQTTARRDPAESPRCPHCDAVLPEAAAFCGACGEPIEEQASASHAADDEDISARYRITSLVRRRPYISLYFATDSRTQRPVALTDIDMSSLDEQAQGKALQLVKREYNLLSRQQIPYVMPVIEQMYRRGHLSIVAGNPFVSTATGKADARSEQAKAGEQLRTLHDVLQS